MAENRKFLIGRQPILNRVERIVAYELLFRSAESKAAAMLKSASHATASVIVNALSGFGMKEILGNHQGFINVDIDLLMSDAIEILPRELIGLDLQGGIKVGPEVVARCRALKESGFALALDRHEYGVEYEELYGLVDIVKVDLIRTPIERLHAQVEQLRRYPVKLLAGKVDTVDVYRMCMRLGFDYFQGYYFARPSVMEKKQITDSHGTLLKLLRLLLADATLGEIAKVFRDSPTLTYKLLLLVNSVAFGMREKIRDVRHALSILGRLQLKRWVQLALFSAENAEANDTPLAELAAARAAFMEQLAAEQPELKGQYAAADQAFMIGILSLLDVIYQVSLDEIVTDLNLSDAVREALVAHEGIYGRLLELTVMMERLELGEAAVGLQEMGISLEGIIDSQKKALCWREVI